MQNHDKKFRVKVGLAEMLKGGVIMDVTTADQAKIAEDAGAAAVMAKRRHHIRIEKVRVERRQVALRMSERSNS